MKFDAMADQRGYQSNLIVVHHQNVEDLYGTLSCEIPQVQQTCERNCKGMTSHRDMALSESLSCCKPEESYFFDMTYVEHHTPLIATDTMIRENESSSREPELCTLDAPSEVLGIGRCAYVTRSALPQVTFTLYLLPPYRYRTSTGEYLLQIAL